MLATFAAVAIVALGCVVMHWATLEWLIRRFCSPSGRLAWELLLGVLLLLSVHLLEITFITATMWALYAVAPGSAGHLQGEGVDAFADVWYYVACVYTTVGFGDIVPVGPGRLLAGIIALVGLLMITWSASFTFLVMQRSWAHRFENIEHPGR